MGSKVLKITRLKLISPRTNILQQATYRNQFKQPAKYEQIKQKGLRHFIFRQREDKKEE